VEHPFIALTAVFFRSGEGYVGFVEELPGVNAYGRTLAEVRHTLIQVAAVVFDEQRRGTEEFIAGKDYVREPVTIACQMRAGEYGKSS
jgi:predicted RNase H-like HicB family nuclease